MTDYQIIVSVCLLGILGEALRLGRPGQVLLAPGLTGQYSPKSIPKIVSSETFAIHLAPLLPLGPMFRMKGSSDSGGPSAIDHLDMERAREKIERVLQSTELVVAASQLLFLYLTLLVPLVLLTGLVPHGWMVLGGSLVIIQSLLLVSFGLAHRRLHRGDLGKRIQGFITMALFPPAGIFAADRIAAETVDDIHPLAATLVLCPEAEARRIAGRYLRQWRYPLKGDDPGRAAEYLEAATALLDSQGWNPEEIAGPPLPDDLESLSYCPRCHAQFMIDEGMCPDCPGIPKTSFIAP